MPYQYIEFDGVPLPLFNPEQDHSAPGAPSSLIPSIGGVFDHRGDRVGLPQPQVHRLTGYYLAARPVLIDEAGNWIVNEGGFPIVPAAEPSTILRSQLLELGKKVRQRGRLVRVRLDDGVRTWKTARFLSLTYPQNYRDRLNYAQITCEFETAMLYWHADEPKTATATTADGIGATLTVFNAEVAIEDAVLTLTGVSGTITQVRIVGDGVDLTWAGSVGAGDVLRLDAGTVTIRKNDVDAYAGLTFGVDHASAGWLTLAPGTVQVVVTTTGGTAAVELDYYPAWA